MPQEPNLLIAVLMSLSIAVNVGFWLQSVNAGLAVFLGVYATFYLVHCLTSSLRRRRS